MILLTGKGFAHLYKEQGQTMVAYGNVRLFLSIDPVRGYELRMIEQPGGELLLYLYGMEGNLLLQNRRYDALVPLLAHAIALRFDEVYSFCALG